MEYNSLNIQSIFTKFFKQYIDRGYIQMLTEVYYLDSQNLDSIRIQLKNNAINREFSFRFQPYNGYDRACMVELVWFSIDKENCKNRLRISDYWRKMKGEENYIPTSLLRQGEKNTVEERLESYFEIINSTLENELKLVVEGKEWIDLPFDFYPYK